MHRLHVTIRVNGQPAKHLYVEHMWKVLDIRGPLGLYITDKDGQVQDTNGNLGINSLTREADILILGQNSVARILKGGSSPFMVLPVWVDNSIRDNAVVNLGTFAEKVDHFRILNLAIQSYEQVHKKFPPFSALPDNEAMFPLGRRPTLQETKDQAKRIEIVFPDNLPQTLAFCEPMSLGTGYPLIHLKGRLQNFDDRLFGTNGAQPTLMPSELAHALHFSLLDRNARGRVELGYVKFLLEELVAGWAPAHDMGRITSVMVAYVEAFDHFSSRFSVFTRVRQPGPNLEAEFIASELSVRGNPSSQAGRLIAGVVTPMFTGVDQEGTIYGAIFLDFARRTTLATAVGAYFESQALSFGEYRNWIRQHRPQHDNEIDEVKRTWGL